MYGGEMREMREFCNLNSCYSEIFELYPFVDVDKEPNHVNFSFSYWYCFVSRIYWWFLYYIHTPQIGIRAL